MSKKTNSKYISDGMLGALVAIISILVIFAVILTVFIIAAKPFSDDGAQGHSKPSVDSGGDFPFKQDFNFKAPTFLDNSAMISSGDIDSEKALIMNVTDNKILASRQSEVQMYPASMTKVMTLIVVYENLKNEASLNDVLTVSTEIVEENLAESGSGFGLKAGEKLTVKDLLYVMMFQSDNIACKMLAEYVAGSEGGLVKMMNDKVTELGMSNNTTLFQNTTGIHHKYHYTTCKDMATIMSYAMKNTFCAEIMTAKKYVPSDNFRPGDGITFWNKLLVHDLGDGKTEPKTATFAAGKTGWNGNDTSGHCIVTYAKGDNGKDYIVVTNMAETKLTSIEDHLYLYNTYAK